MDVSTVATVAGIASAAVGIVVAAVVPVIRLLRRLLRQVAQLQEDWFGEPARPGFDARPGIPERLWKIERELIPNGGSSARDAISRIELNQNRLSIDHAILARRMDAHLEQVAPAIAELNEWHRSRNTLPDQPDQPDGT